MLIFDPLMVTMITIITMIAVMITMITIMITMITVMITMTSVWLLLRCYGTAAAPAASLRLHLLLRRLASSNSPLRETGD